ncbi:GntR family transcriptional regulator [Geotalea uraniireducens]|uniref:GntR family transcriptional regulator n=1 Tax=Geotalea uraniireducens TaxID=351604 RepID=A0ABN6VVK2_9BACT|nr:GntR family transcriptional regulator [Geotalea uraniireducens]BDV42207.1 GntR family transcriptional regulator [Geotalea uraniireducens]
MNKLDGDSRLPLYCRLELELRRAIAAGTWRVDEAIPPERVLVEQYGVSRITVRQALANLVAEGLLYRKHGTGTFVAAARSGAIAESLSELTGHLEELQLRGLAPQVRVLTLERRELPAKVAAALERPAGAAGWYLYRIVTVGRQPLMLSTVWLPADLGIELTGAMVAREGMARLLTAHGHLPEKGVQRIGAVAAGPEEARLLGVRKGDPALRVCRVIVGAGGRPLVWFRTLYRADRYEYEVELKRRRA